MVKYGLDNLFSLLQTPLPNIYTYGGDASNAMCLNLRQLPHPDYSKSLQPAMGS
jgi:hypothetical protein